LAKQSKLSRLVLGPDPAFSAQGLASLLDLPWILLLGAVIGGLAAGYAYGNR
jgi:hypothetical protein